MFGNLTSLPPIYDPTAVQPMRDELTWVGFEELRTPADVDKAVSETKGTLLVVVNSVCGCAAGSARPGVAMALQNKTIPDRLTTVFAGQDREATARVREHIADYPPSSPSLALFKGGKVLYMLERYQIEGRSPEQIAQTLMPVFEELCTKEGPSVDPDKYKQLVHAKACGSTIPRVGM
jgi:putative YphP/YqiW family bacilliredoxin